MHLRSCVKNIIFIISIDTAAYRANQQRQMVNKWSREDLEDKYLRIYEENQVLKRHGRKQEEKIKK